MSFGKEVIQYAIHKLSSQIFDLKQAAEGKMSPQHPDWEKYKETKRQASLHLTALGIFKHFGERIPSKPDLRKAIRAGCFLQHAPKGDKSKRNVFIFEAYSLLQSGFPEINRSEAMAYSLVRKQEAEHAKSSC